ncbi:ABC transporter ATP-binding protein [Nakamurella sp. GG22]
MSHAAPTPSDLVDGSTPALDVTTAPPTNGGRPAARAVDLRKIYGSGDTKVAALDGVTVEFYPGQFTAIMGPSGSGKSTLMHCLAALDEATSGQVFVGDADLTTLGDKELTRIRRDRIGFVFQSFNLVPTLTAVENITLPMDIAGRKPDKAWLDSVISTVGLGDRLNHKPSQLSGGQQQRVACARALAGRPDIVFADEPTGNLDSVSGAEVLGFLAGSVRDFGQTVVMVTHDPNAAGYADRVLFLADGRIVDEMTEPTAERVLDRMKNFDAQHPSAQHPSAQQHAQQHAPQHAAGS